MKKYILTGLILLGLCVALSGCGGSANDNVTVPYDGSITIQPGDTTYTFGPRVAPFTDSHNFTITVFNSNGIPLDGVLVWMDFAWAAPNPGYTVQFYDSDGDKKNAPMNATTDKNGVYVLRMDYDGGCGMGYFADLIVNSGSVYAPKVKFTVEGEDCS